MKLMAKIDGKWEMLRSYKRSHNYREYSPDDEITMILAGGLYVYSTAGKLELKIEPDK